MAYGTVYITTQGAILAAKTLESKILRFSKFIVGDGKLASEDIETIKALTTLINSKLSFNVTKVSKDTDTQVTVRGLFQNTDAEEGFYIRELGLYAIDPDTKSEILFAYVNYGEEAEYINNSITEKKENYYKMIITVDNAQNVEITVDQNTIYITEKEFEEKLNELSKTYKGTNITAPTIKGFGKVNRLYGKTELSSNNLTCVSDKHINLFNINDIVSGSIDSSTGASSTSGGLYITQNYINVKSGTTYANSNVEGLLRIFEYNNSKGLIKTFTTNDGTFTTSATTKYIKIQKGTPFGHNYKLEEGSESTSYSKFEEGVIKIVSKNGENTSTKSIACKPLCCLKDAENNVIAQDYIDFTENKIHRECGYIASYNNENITTDYISSTGSLSAGATVVYKLQNLSEEDFNCNDGIVQYDNQTTIYNSDDAKMEITLTQNQMISNINKNINDIQQGLNNTKILELNFGALPNKGTKSIQHGLSNVEIEYFYAKAKNQNGTRLTIPHASVGGGTVEIGVNNTELSITTATDRSNYNATAYIIYKEN